MVSVYGVEDFRHEFAIEPKGVVGLAKLEGGVVRVELPPRSVSCVELERVR